VRVFKHDKTSLGELHVDDAVQIGRTDYRVRRVALGGMGIVLLLERDAEQPQTDSDVHGLRIAVKSVLPERIGQENIALFRRELTVWAGLRHPNVVGLNEILDAGRDGWVAAMSWCEGSLRDRLSLGRKMPEAHATMVLLDLVEGLAYAQQKDGVVHLDVKPENVLYIGDIKRLLQYAEGDDRRYRFMLSDWGIASVKQRELDAIATLPRNAELSLRTFNNMGTILYMAPERFIDGYRSSVASDIFSLGMVYLEMLTGALPFDRSIQPIESLLSHTYFGHAARLLRNASIAPMIQALTLGMLSPDPAKRPESYDGLKLIVSACYRLANGTFSVDDVLKGPFDRTESGNATLEELARWEAEPEVERALFSAKKDYAKQLTANLRAVGRAVEADEIVANYLDELFARWEEEPENPYHLTSIANTAITLEGLDAGKKLLEAAIAKTLQQSIPLDLTLAYWNLGRIHHYLRRQDSDELWCYERAVESEPPPNCRFPADCLQKARAHFFAFSEAGVLGKQKHQRWHQRRMQELAPHVNWESREEIVKFLSAFSEHT
jgi:serine/threonine protein kinase